MSECPLCKGAGIVIFRDGIPEDSRGRQSEEHMQDQCPECLGSGLEGKFAAGALAMRDMIARFVDHAGDSAMAASIRANWNPEWGTDPLSRC